MTMRRHDLNLIPVLDALLRHRNVTRAGNELGLSQSATSHALARLRDHFGDKLLAQVGNEFVLTHRAEVMRDLLGETMDRLARLLETDDFDPAHAQRRFKVGTADYIAHLMLPAVLARTTSEAPRVSLQVTWDRDQMAAKLRNGQLDLALVPRGSLDAEDLHSLTLLSDELVVIAAADHAVLADHDTLDRETFLTLPYAGFRRENAPDKSFAQQQLAAHQLTPNEVVLLPDFLVLGFTVASTQCISLIPRRMAERLQATLGLRIFAPPFAAERLHIQAYWSHDADGDGAHRWFRSLVQQVCAELGSAPRDMPQNG